MLRAGKRELPAALRNRFTEMYVSEPTALADLRAVVAEYLAGAAPNPPLDAVVDFYIAAKHEAVRLPSHHLVLCCCQELQRIRCLVFSQKFHWTQYVIGAIAGMHLTNTAALLIPTGAAASLGCQSILVLSAPTGVPLYPSVV